MKIGNEEVEDVEEFVYLGTIVINKGGGMEDIKKRFNKVREIFVNWMKICKIWSFG